ncbi:MAG: hypothetical protein WAV21_02390 [Minisyncoccia bacterium]
MASKSELPGSEQFIRRICKKFGCDKMGLFRKAFEEANRDIPAGLKMTERDLKRQYDAYNERVRASLADWRKNGCADSPANVGLPHFLKIFLRSFKNEDRQIPIFSKPEKTPYYRFPKPACVC